MSNFICRLIVVFTFVSQAHAAFIEVPEPLILEEISQTAPGPLPTRLSVMTWNIQKASGEDRWQRDLQKLSTGKQIIVLQEGTEAPRVLNTLHALKTFGWWMARSFFLETDRNATGVQSGATQMSLSQDFLRSRDREPFVNTPKMSLLTTFQMQDGGQLLVVNVHAINFTTVGPFQRQMEDIAHVLQSWQGRILWAGDFNTWSPARQDQLQLTTQKAGLKEVAFRKDPRHLVLDHIFLKGCSAVSSQVHADIDSSDHYPLSAEIQCDR